jgi:tetratricopeptide (TPR) repeat protein
VALLKKGRAEEAAESLQNGLRLRPNDVDIRLHLGRSYLERNRPDEAIAVFREALGVAQTADAQASVYMEIGTAEYMRQKDEAALAAFLQALRLNPALSPARKNAGITYGNLGRRQDAIRELSIYLSTNPSDTAVRQAIEALQRTQAGPPGR